MKNGIYDLPPDQYHDLPGLSCSLIKILLAKSPLHAWMASPMNPEREKFDAHRMDIGTAAHAMLLEGNDTVMVCEFDDWRTKAAQAARDEARALGKIPLLPRHYEQVQAMVSVAHAAFLNCADLDVSWADGKPEQSVLWQEGETDCRMRADWLSNDHRLIIDFKTSEIANPQAWMRSLPSQGYDIQAAMYKRGVKAATGVEPDFVFLVQEVSPPYCCYFVGLPPAYLEIGNQKVGAALVKWAECMRTNNWPAYPSRILYPDPPSWLLAEAEELACGTEKVSDFDAPQSEWTREGFMFGKVKD